MARRRLQAAYAAIFVALLCPPEIPPAPPMSRHRRAHMTWSHAGGFQLGMSGTHGSVTRLRLRGLFRG